MILSLVATLGVFLLEYDALLSCPDLRSKALSIALGVLVLCAVWRVY